MYHNDLAEIISLDGIWQFALGEDKEWNDILVPGCWEAQGYSKYLEGPARYRRVVFLPDEWNDRRIVIEFGAVSYACTVYCNGIEAGNHIGLWAPFTVDITTIVFPGRENVLELVIWKPGERYPMRSSLAGFLPDVATTFGGPWQPVRLRAETCSIEQVSIQADYSDQSIRFQAQANFSGLPEQPFCWRAEVFSEDTCVARGEWALTKDKLLDVSVRITETLLWDPNHPNLYLVHLSLFLGDRKVAQVSRRVGFRSLTADGSQLLFNDQPMMVRGILSWGWEPERIAPAYTREQARDEIHKARQMGFNLIKLCLFIPNPNYFAVADEEGMLLWVEMPMWLPEVNNNLRVQAPREYAAIARMLAHHPSIVLYSLGCEMNKSVDRDFLNGLNRAVRAETGDVLMCDNSGSGESYGGLDIDIADFTDYHPYYDLQFFEPLIDNWRRDWQSPRPLIFGEFCDSDTFRDLTEIIAANNGKRPWWLTTENPVTTWRSESKATLEWESRLEKASAGFSFPEMTQVSFQQSYSIRKYTLESLRRRKGIGGYIITGLRDTPISTSGIWDDIGRAKWAPDRFLEINGDAGLSLDVARRRRWRNGGDRPDRVDLFCKWAGEQAAWALILNHMGLDFSADSSFFWRMQDSSGNVVASGQEIIGKVAAACIPTQVGGIQVSLPNVDRPVELVLEAGVVDGERCAKNHWTIWVFPKPTLRPEGLAVHDPTGQFEDFGDWIAQAPRTNAPQRASVHILVTTVLDSAVWEYLWSGGRVLLLQQGDAPLPTRRCPFWREAVKLFSPHPVWKYFPNQGFTDLQFLGLASDLAFDTPRLEQVFANPMVIHTILRRLDAREFHISEYLFEASVGVGLLLGCALRLQGGMGSQPSGWEKNVAGTAMLHTLLNYLSEPK